MRAGDSIQNMPRAEQCHFWRGRGSKESKEMTLTFRLGSGLDPLNWRERAVGVDRGDVEGVIVAQLGRY